MDGGACKICPMAVSYELRLRIEIKPANVFCDFLRLRIHRAALQSVPDEVVSYYYNAIDGLELHLGQLDNAPFVMGAEATGNNKYESFF